MAGRRNGYQSKNACIALAGSGYWGKNLARNFHALGALHTVVDTNPETLQQIIDQYPSIKGTASFADILGDTEIKGIAIATPAETHATLAKEALLAGKDVYIEKPLCLSESEGYELIELAEQRDRILMVGHLLWYHPALLKLKQLVEQGELGRIRYIYSNRLNMGKLRREENVLWSFAPHDVSVILGLLGEIPESVQAHGGNYLHQKISDVTVSLLSFASGIKAHIFVSWLHPYKEQKLVVVGNQKMAVFDDTAPWERKLALYPHHVTWKGQIPLAVKAEAEFVEIQEEEPLRAECMHFLECIHTRQRPRTDGNEGLQVLRVLNASQKALETNRVITLTQESHYQAPYQVHPTAEIDDNVEIGPGTRIWHFSHILEGSRIGPKCNIGQNVVIGPRVSIGKGSKIQNNVSIYEGVTLEDHVFCGPSVVFTNVYNPRAEVPRMKELRRTLVKRGATLGANSTIVCGTTIGSYAFVGAGAVVNRDVPDFGLVVGNPARRIGWMCKCGERLGDDLTCQACGAAYKPGDNNDTIHRSQETI